jgi:hypothetical protein
MGRLISILVFWTFISCGQRSESTANSNLENDTIKHTDKSLVPFELIVYDSDYSMAYSLQYVLTENDLQIIFKGGLKDETDSTLFKTNLERTLTLEKLSNISLDSLHDNYRNPCVKDGLQLTVELRKDGKTKAIHISNYYQEDIGLAIELINSLTPSKYKIWYDKTELLENQKNCK